jgi:hypothetical protein
MTRMVNIEWPDFKTTVAFSLLEDDNPKLSEAFWKGLPFESVFNASMSGGEMYKVPVPFRLPTAGPFKSVFFPDQPPGSIVVVGGSLLIKYGTVIEPFRLPALGLISKTELGRLLPLTDRLREAYWFTKVINKAIFSKAA